MEEIKIALADILSELKSINQSITKSLDNDPIRSDHYQSDHQIRSDRSDQIRSSKNSSNHDNFLQICDQLGIEHEHLDLSNLDRNINYFMQNLNKITSKKAYINRILENTPTKARQKMPAKEPVVESEEPDNILGIPAVEVEEKSQNLDQEVFTKLCKDMTKAERSMFPHLREVQSKQFKLNIVTAKAIKMGLL